MKEDIKAACETLERGGIILYPTDTIWGIGCDATNANAVQRIYEIKQRSDTKSMLVLLDSVAKLAYYVEDIPEIAFDLIDLSEKPLTLIYSGARNLATNLIAQDGSIGIRITKEVFSQELCKRFRKPLVSTSANISGQATPALFAEINENIIRSVDYVVNYKQDETNKSRPSSIIRLDKGGLVKIVRE
jgi:Sua5/YciO/YrdC/YwlC family protein